MKAQWKLLGALALIALVVGWLARDLRPPTRRSIHVYEAFIGQKLAEEAVRLVDSQHTIVLLLPVGSEAGLKSAMNGFVSAVRKQNGKTTVHIERVSVDSSKLQAGQPAIAAGDFAEVLTRYPEAAVVASMVGVPDLVTLTNQPIPRLVVLCATAAGVQPLLESGAVTVAIVPRDQFATGPTGSAGSVVEARFQREYEVRRASP